MSAVAAQHHGKIKNSSEKGRRGSITQANFDNGRRKETPPTPPRDSEAEPDEEQEKDAFHRLKNGASQRFQAVGQTIISSVRLQGGSKENDAVQDPAPQISIGSDWSSGQLQDGHAHSKPTPTSELSRGLQSDKSLTQGSHESKELNFHRMIKDGGEALRSDSMYPTYAYLDKMGKAMHDHDAIPKGGSRFFNFVARILTSHWCDICMGGVIVLNLVFISLEQKSRLENETVPLYSALEHIFLTIYVVEVVGRFYVWGISFLRTAFAAFDFFIVVVGVAITWCIKPFFDDVELGPLFILRIARLMRLVRALRVLVIFRELWMLVRGLLSSFRTMVYTVLLLTTMLYAFASVGLEILSRHPMAVGSDHDVVFREIVTEFFTDLPTAMLTLVQFVTFDNVVYIYTPLIKRDPRLLPFFVMILLVVGIVLMNLVTAVIVNNALEQANQDKDLIASVEEEKKKKMVKEMRKIFLRLDEDNSGQVSRQEIQAISDDDREALAKLMGIGDPLEIFDSLDVDGDEEIGIDEFVDGIWHVVVSNTPIHVKRMEKQLDRILQHVRDTQDHQLEFENKIDKKIDKVLLQLGRVRSDSGKLNGVVSSAQSSAFLPQSLKSKEKCDAEAQGGPETSRKSWKELADEEGGASEEYDSFAVATGHDGMPVWAHELIHEMHEVCRAAREMCWRDKMSRGTKDLRNAKAGGTRKRTMKEDDDTPSRGKQVTPKAARGGPSPEQSSSTDGTDSVPRAGEESGSHTGRGAGKGGGGGGGGGASPPNRSAAGLTPHNPFGLPEQHSEGSKKSARTRASLKEIPEVVHADIAMPMEPPASYISGPRGLYSSSPRSPRGRISVSDCPDPPPVADPAELERRRVNL